MTRPDTICALASGAPPSAIALIRVSGPAVPSVIETLLNRSRLTPRRATRVRIIGADGSQVDDAVAVFFPAPNSFTGEDVLELSVHGGRAVVDDVLDLLTAPNGVRLAEPGEFTRRAFEAGKLDLTQAEGIGDLIDAETRAQREQAIRQLDGHLSDRFSQWRQTLLEAMAMVEVAVDFPDEEDAPDFTHDDARERIETLRREIAMALDDGALGEKVREGFRIALVGPPNAGKSSLLNRLAGREAAIVTELPGTTRDIVEVRLDVAGHLVLVQDTAGLRESDDRIESEGIRRARHAAESADLRLLVWDATRPVEARDQLAREVLRAGDLIVANKSDLEPRDDLAEDVSRETLPVSALTGAGFDRLVEALGARISQRITGRPAPLITRRRHRDRLSAAAQALSDASRLLEDGGPSELAAEDIRLAVRALSQLVGEIGVEDILGEVFSQFCIGK